MKLLETPEQDVFAAVGLAHLIGEGSMAGLLRESGYTVERLYLCPASPEGLDNAA